MPGGVSSPVRAFKSVNGDPIVFDRVKGAYAWDLDGDRFIDYVGSWGPAICGHSHPEVIASLQEALEKGTSFGAPCELENKLAEMVIEAVPSVDRIFSTAKLLLRKRKKKFFHCPEWERLWKREQF